MAFCRNCGTQLSEGAKFCPKCGTSISPVTNDNSGKSLSKRIVIPLIVSILILAIAGVGWYLWKNQSEDYSLEGLSKVALQYDDVGDFHCGRAYVFLRDEDCSGKIGYIDKRGNEIVPCKYSTDYGDDNDFYDGVACVCDEKYGYIDVNGKEITPCVYDEAGRFSEGYAVATRDGRYYIIDKTGKEIEINYRVDLMSNYFSEGLLAVYGDDGIGFVNSDGKLIIPCKYSTLSETGVLFKDGLVSVYNGEKCGYIDKTGKVAIPYAYDDATPFSEGLAAVEKDGKWFYINTEGKKVLDVSSSFPFGDGLAVAVNGEKFYYIDKKGKTVIDNNYNSASTFINGYARVGKKVGDDYLYGIIDKTGKEIIPCLYNIRNLSEDLCVMRKDDLVGFIDIKGNNTFDLNDDEIKMLVKQKLDVKKREEEKKQEEERKRIEEENKPYNKFKSVISQNSFVWEGPSVESDHVEVLYFNQLNNSIGNVSLVTFKNTFTSYSMRWSGNGTYSIVDDIVEFYIEWKMTNFAREPRGERIVLRIENYGDNVKLVDVKSNRTYIPRRATVNNPIR